MIVTGLLVIDFMVESKAQLCSKLFLVGMLVVIAYLQFGPSGDAFFLLAWMVQGLMIVGLVYHQKTA
jgi:hypothetical protein